MRGTRVPGRPAYNRRRAKPASRSTAMTLRMAKPGLGLLVLAAAAALAQPAGHVTGIGGVFIKAKEPKALAAWSRDMLGLPLQPWDGAALRYDAPGHPPAAAWRAFAASSSYLSPST